MQISRSAPPSLFPQLPAGHGRTSSPSPTRPAGLSRFRPHSTSDVAASRRGTPEPQPPLCTQFFHTPPRDPGTHRLLRRYLLDLEQRRVALKAREHERLQQDAPLRARVEAAGLSFRDALALLDPAAPSRLIVIAHTSLTSESACGVAVVDHRGTRNAAQVALLAACPEVLFGEDAALGGVGRTLLGACVRLSTMTGHDGRLEVARPPAHAASFLAACHFVQDDGDRWALEGPGLSALKREVNPRLPQ